MAAIRKISISSITATAGLLLATAVACGDGDSTTAGTVDGGGSGTSDAASTGGTTGASTAGTTGSSTGGTTGSGTGGTVSLGTGGNGMGSECTTATDCGETQVGTACCSPDGTCGVTFTDDGNCTDKTGGGAGLDGGGMDFDAGGFGIEPGVEDVACVSQMGTGCCLSSGECGSLMGGNCLPFGSSGTCTPS